MARKTAPQRYAEKVLLVVGIYLVLFTITQTILTAVTGIEQTTLIEQNFLVAGIEVGVLMLKRVCEIVFKKKEDSDDV